ncbi:MAG: hypothetical protein ABMA02_03995 [Saprospiraceae bacterium]
MKRESSVLKTTFFVVVFLAILASSCTNVYFENPVPQRGERVLKMPAELAGTYVLEPKAGETVSELEQVVRNCIRIEADEAGNMLVSGESRLLAKDLPRFKNVLEAQKREGKVHAYRLTASHLICTVKTDAEEGQSAGSDEQHISLIKSGPWYVLGQSAKPMWFFDFAVGRQLEYDKNSEGLSNSKWIDDADRVSADTAQLIALQQSKIWYFNTRKGDEKAWSLVCVQRESSEVLAVRWSNLNNKSAFLQRMDYYNAITPFRKEGDNRFVINPTDEALNQLMRDEQLFETMRLRKVE